MLSVRRGMGWGATTIGALIISVRNLRTPNLERLPGIHNILTHLSTELGTLAKMMSLAISEGLW